MSTQLSKADIFKMVENGQIAAEEAFKMIKGLQAKKAGTSVAAAPKPEPQRIQTGKSAHLSDEDILVTIRKELIAGVSDILKVDEKKVLIDKDMKDFGFDSISLTGYNNRIGEKYGINISPTIFLEYSTIEALADYLLNEYKEVLTKYYQGSVKETLVVEKENKVFVEASAPAREDKKSVEVSSNGPVWLISASSEFPMDFWKRILDEGLPSYKGENITLQEFSSVMKQDKKYIHALVETSFGSKMEVLAYGHGSVAVVVGGVGMAAPMSLYQINALAKNHQVLVIHNPGCGMSEDISDYTISFRCKVIADVLDKLGVDHPIHFIGMSWGGMIGQYFSKEYPDRVASLNLISSIYEIVDENPGVNANDSMRMDLENIDGGIQHYELMQKGLCLNPVIFAKYMNYYLPGTATAYSTYDILEEIKTPTFIAAGLKDGIINPRQSRMIHSKIANSQYCEIPDAGHFLFMTHHAILNEKLLDFMGKHDSAVADNIKANIHGTSKKASLINIGEYEKYIGLIEDKLDKEFAIKGIECYEGFEEAINALCTSYICNYFTSCGVNTEKGQIYSIDELRKTLKIMPKFDKFFNFFIKALLEDRVIRELDNKIQFIKKPEEIGQPDPLYKNAIEKYPEFSGMLEFLHYCVDNYKKALSGEIFAVGVLFPNGRADALEESTKKTVEHGKERLYANVVKEIIALILEKKTGGKKLRILEVGGGNGLLTRQLVPVTDTPKVEYYFTDIGEYFVKKAKQDSAFGFMNFGMLDISKAPSGQGYEEQSFDMVLGLNVVHATKSIEETARNLKKLLAPGGIMGLIEATKPLRWVDMVWGLAEGWWYFEDEDLRKYSPLISPGKWEELMQKLGFDYVKTYPANDSKRFDADSALVIARKNPNSK